MLRQATNFKVTKKIDQRPDCRYRRMARQRRLRFRLDGAKGQSERTQCTLLQRKLRVKDDPAFALLWPDKQLKVKRVPKFISLGREHSAR